MKYIKTEGTLPLLSESLSASVCLFVLSLSLSLSLSLTLSLSLSRGDGKGVVWRESSPHKETVRQ